MSQEDTGLRVLVVDPCPQARSSVYEAWEDGGMTVLVEGTLSAGLAWLPAQAFERLVVTPEALLGEGGVGPERIASLKAWIRRLRPDLAEAILLVSRPEDRSWVEPLGLPGFELSDPPSYEQVVHSFAVLREESGATLRSRVQ